MLMLTFTVMDLASILLMFICLLAIGRLSTCDILPPIKNGCMLRNSSQGVKAYCSHLGLTAVPRNLPGNTVTLDLSNNNLTALHNDDFTEIPLLVTLSLINNQIAAIQNETFHALGDLRMLALNGNRLADLDPSTFINNLVLSNVRLGYNQLEAIPNAALSLLTRMHVLFLYGNIITRLDFEGLPHLSNIIMTQNEVENITEGDFRPLHNTSLNRLELISNKIHVLPERVFSDLKSVLNFRIDSNYIHTFSVSPFLGISTIGELSATGCQIDHLSPPNSSLPSLDGHPIVGYLNLDRNIITSIPEGALWGFDNLKGLSLMYNKIAVVTNKSFCALLSLTELNIAYNELQHLPDGAFACMPSLKRLNASGNLLVRLSSNSFSGMPSIISLTLIHNLISSCENQRWTLETLQHLDISHNLLSSVQRNCLTDLSNLRVLNISFNHLSDYGATAFSQLETLQELHLSNELRTNLKGVFRQLRSLYFLDLSNTGIVIGLSTPIDQFSNASSLRELRMENAHLSDKDLFDTQSNLSLFQGLSTLQRLRLKRNIMRSPDARVFQNLTNLYYLDLTSSGIQLLQNGIFSSLNSLTILYLSGNKLMELPPNIFGASTGLRVLYMQNNTLKGIRTDTFAGVRNLHELYLPGNHINTIIPQTILPSNTSLIFDISRNPFSCTCSLAWFRQWLADTDIKFKHPNQTVCSITSIKSLVNHPILSFQPDVSCGLPVMLIVCASLAVVFVALVVLLGYKKRWLLNYKCFLFRLAIFGYEEVVEEYDEGDYEYQLNLMFHPADEWWIERVMKPAVEDRFPDLQRIVYGDDDLHVGMFYINAIHDAIESSYKTAMLLSNASVDDAWFMTKLRMALEHINDTRLDKIILIFVEDIADDNLPYLVRLFLSKNKPYLLWTEDGDGQELFWAQFEKSIKTNRVINNAIPI